MPVSPWICDIKQTTCHDTQLTTCQMEQDLLIIRCFVLLNLNTNANEKLQKGTVTVLTIPGCIGDPCSVAIPTSIYSHAFEDQKVKSWWAVSSYLTAAGEGAPG